MSDFFEKKLGNEIKKPPFGDYDFSQENTLTACGLNADSKDFTDRNDLFITDVVSISSRDKGLNKTALVSKSVESHFTTREMAFLLGKYMIGDFINQIKDKENGK